MAIHPLKGSVLISARGLMIVVALCAGVGIAPISAALTPTPVPPPPSFALGEIPPILIEPGASITFDVAAAPSISCIASIQIHGNLLCGTHFLLQLDSKDKTPFTITITTTSGESQVVTVTPEIELPAEASLINTSPDPVPDRESSTYASTYIVTTDVASSAPESFNTETLTTHAVTIAGPTIIFQKGHANGLYEKYSDVIENGQAVGVHNISDLTIYADTLIIRDPLLLPGTNITIYARELDFVDGSSVGYARIDTTPRTFVLGAACPPPPQPCIAAAHGQPAEGGGDGFDAGAIALYIDTLPSSGPSGQPRFIANGGKGQDPQLGSNGDAGASRPLCTAPFISCGTCGLFTLPSGFIFSNCDSILCPGPSACGNPTCTVARWPDNGENATPGGVPGQGGAGGMISSNQDMQSLAVASAGAAGRSAGHYTGGNPGQPNPAYEFVGCLLQSHTQSPGADAQSPSGIRGAAGSFHKVGNPYSWVSPGALRLVLSYVRALYIARHFDSVSSLLNQYQDILGAYQGSPDWTALSSQWQMELVQGATEITGQLQQLEANLDYFGNPAGWAPLLSLEVLAASYNHEIEPALRAMYLAHRLKEDTAHILDTRHVLETTRSQLSLDLQNLQRQYNDAQATASSLVGELSSITNQITVVQAELSDREQALEQLAISNVEVRNAKPAWQKDLSILSTIAEVLPVAQPVLGAIGLGLGFISQFDPADPLKDVTNGINLVKSIGTMAPGFADDANKWGTALDNALQNVSVDPGYLTAKSCRSGMSGPPLRSCSDDSGCSGLGMGVSCVSNAGAASQNLNQLYQPIQKVADTVKMVSSATQVSTSDVQAELNRIEAVDSYVNDFKQQLTSLSTQKQAFAEHLASVVQTIASVTNEVQKDLLAADSVSENIARNAQVPDERVMQYISDIDLRARQRLVKYVYYLVKAFEYRTLTPYQGTFGLDSTSVDLEPVFNEFLQIEAEAHSTESLTADQYTNELAPVFEGVLSKIKDQIITYYTHNAPAPPTSFSFPLTDSELSLLNAGSSVRINLKERGAIPANQDGLRLISIGVPAQLLSNIQVSSVGGIPPSARVQLDITHPGVGFIEKGTQTFIVRNFNNTTSSPLTWTTTYDINENQISLTTPFDHSEIGSLLASLSGDPVPDPAIFSHPTVWSDLTLTRSDNSIGVVNVDGLRLNVTYEYTSRANDGNAVLNVALAPLGPIPASVPDPSPYPLAGSPPYTIDGPLPYIALGTADLNGRQDGRGNFRRVYRPGQSITLTAPDRYPDPTGIWSFDHWDGHTVGSSTITMTMARDVMLTAHYNPSGSAANTPTPTPIVTPTPTTHPCVGDCNSNGEVTVDELLTMVNIALGNAHIEACRAGDKDNSSTITIDEILTAVNYALTTCPAS